MSQDVKKRPELADTNGEQGRKAKVARVVPPVNLNPLLQDSKFLQELQSCWGKDTVDKNGFKLGTSPFLHAEIKNIIADSEILTKLQEVLDYEEKSSDLFHFHQSCDLSMLPDGYRGFEAIEAINNFFKTKLFEAIKTLTGLPLSGKFDIFASQYLNTDHLLCHDDELDSRRVAFIIYMSEDWKEEYGGTLDLFDSVEDEDGPRPTKIIKSIVPEFNKIAFFEVTARSFHQVSEVTHKTACRRAISGWYYGDALPRPSVNLPEDVFENVQFLERKELSLDSYLDLPYLEAETLKTANDQLSENSEILLSSFFTPDKYKAITKKLEAIPSSKLEVKGPANLRRYECLSSLDTQCPSELLDFFGSKNFLEFLQELTEFPFASEPELRFTCSLKKFQNGSYTLVRGKDRSKGYNLNASTANVSKFESDGKEDGLAPGSSDEEENGEEDSDMESPKENGNNGGEALSEENHQAIIGVKNTNGKKDENDKSPPVAENENPQKEAATTESGEEEAPSETEEGLELEEEELVEEEEDEEGSPAGMFLDTEGEDSEEPNRVDVMFFVVPTSSSSSDKSEVPAQEEPSWDESWGGNRIYTDDLTGNQLINVTPEGNALAVVVRDGSISSHYQYVNNLAQNHVFYCYDFEFDFPGSQ